MFAMSSMTLIVCAVVILAASVCVFSIHFRKHSRKFEPPIYPYRLPWLGHALSFLRHAEGLYLDARKHFGSTSPFALYMGGSTLYVVSHPDDVKAIYQNNRQLSFAKIVDEFERTAFGISTAGSQKFWRDIPGEGRLFENAHTFYKSHLTSSERLNPLLDGYLALITSNLVQLRDGSSDTVFPAVNWCQEIVFNAATTAMWGPSLLEHNSGLWKTLVAFDRDLYLLVMRFPSFLCRRVMGHRETLLSVLEQYYADLPELESVAQPCVWERQHMQYRAGLSNREAASFNLSFFWGFNLNLVKTAWWMVYFVVTTPNLQERIRRETAAIFGDDPQDLSLADLADKCSLINATFDEMLRLVSSSTSTRVVTEDYTLGSTVFRAGKRVMLPTQHLHRSTEYWGFDADSFRPERFFKRPNALNEGYYRPFGGGVSLCPGRFFARRAVTSFVAILLRLFDVQFSGPDVAPDYYRPRLAVVDPLPGAEHVMIKLIPRSCQ